MIDIIGAITLTATFCVAAAILIIATPVSTPTRAKLAAIVMGWFASAGTLAAWGLFASAKIGTPAIGTAIVTPVVASLVVAARSSRVRQLAFQIPLATLVVIHVGRLLGVFFLLLFDAGRLPPTFALTAGWGDIVVGAAALPLAWAIRHELAGWQVLTFIWNLLGFADLVTAVTLGVGSAPNSPVRFIFESPNSGAIASLPWVLIPAVLVPAYLLTHVVIFAQVIRSFVKHGQPQRDDRIAWQS